MTLSKARFRILAAALALPLLATTASATPISLTYQGASVADADRQTVKIAASPVAPAANNVYAFGFNMTDTTGTLDSFLAWCLDLGSFLSTSATAAKAYTITDNPFANSYGLNATEQARVQSVFDANYGTLDVTNGVAAAGFQVALWNALYDDDQDAGNGVFKVSNNAAVIAAANGFLTAANAYDGGKAYRLTFLESAPSGNQTKHQNLVTVSPVPLPAAGLLLLAAFGGLGFAARRRKTA